jgi:hypothetical protein
VIKPFEQTTLKPSLKTKTSALKERHCTSQVL